MSWTSDSELRISLSGDVDFALLRTLEKGDLFPRLRDAEVQQRYDSNVEGKASRSEITYKAPQTLDGLVIVESLGKLLSIPNAQTREPSAYGLIGSQDKNDVFFHVRGDATDTAPPLVRRYHEAIALWHTLKREAQHEEESTGALLFFGLRRTEVRPGFDLSDLRQDILAKDIDNFLSNPDRAETRKEIFASVISEFLRDHKPEAAFRVILKESIRFLRRLREGMAIFLSEHSPQKLADEAKSSAISLSEKLEKLVSGLETKSLSIPVAVLLAVKDVSPGAGFTAINSIIAASALTYAITMMLVHQSQSALLRLLRCTIETTVDEYKSKGLDANNPVLAITYSALLSRASGARTGSYCMCSFSWAPLVCVLGVMILGTPKPAATEMKAADTAPALPPQPPPRPLAHENPPTVQFSLPGPGKGTGDSDPVPAPAE